MVIHSTIQPIVAGIGIVVHIDAARRGMTNRVGARVTVRRALRVVGRVHAVSASIAGVRRAIDPITAAGGSRTCGRVDALPARAGVHTLNDVAFQGRRTGLSGTSAVAKVVYFVACARGRAGSRTWNATRCRIAVCRITDLATIAKQSVVAFAVVWGMHAGIDCLVAGIVGAADAVAAIPRCPSTDTTLTGISDGAEKSIVTARSVGNGLRLAGIQ